MFKTIFSRTFITAVTLGVLIASSSLDAANRRGCGRAFTRIRGAISKASTTVRNRAGSALRYGLYKLLGKKPYPSSQALNITTTTLTAGTGLIVAAAGSTIASEYALHTPPCASWGGLGSLVTTAGTLSSLLMLEVIAGKPIMKRVQKAIESSHTPLILLAALYHLTCEIIRASFPIINIFYYELDFLLTHRSLRVLLNVTLIKDGEYRKHILVPYLVIISTIVFLFIVINELENLLVIPQRLQKLIPFRRRIQQCITKIDNRLSSLTLATLSSLIGGLITHDVCQIFTNFLKRDFAYCHFYNEYAPSWKRISYSGPEHPFIGTITTLGILTLMQIPYTFKTVKKWFSRAILRTHMDELNRNAPSLPFENHCCSRCGNDLYPIHSPNLHDIIDDNGGKILAPTESRIPTCSSCQKARSLPVEPTYRSGGDSKDVIDY